MANVFFYEGTSSVGVTPRKMLEIIRLLDSEGLLEDALNNIGDTIIDVSSISGNSWSKTNDENTTKSLRSIAESISDNNKIFDTPPLSGDDNSDLIPIPPAVVNGIKKLLADHGVIERSDVARDVATSRGKYECPPIPDH